MICTGIFVVAEVFSGPSESQKPGSCRIGNPAQPASMHCAGFPARLGAESLFLVRGAGILGLLVFFVIGPMAPGRLYSICEQPVLGTYFGGLVQSVVEAS